MISLKLQQDITNIAIPDNLVDDEIGEYSNVKLAKFVINVKRQIICVLDPFLSYLQKFEPKMSHNMLCFMLAPQYKNLPFIFLFIGHDTIILIINEYDKKSLILMMLKCYEHLYHNFGVLDSQSTQLNINARCNLNIFEMGNCANEPMQECINQNILLFQYI
jgi:hypothetical protein